MKEDPFSDGLNFWTSLWTGLSAELRLVQSSSNTEIKKEFESIKQCKSALDKLQEYIYSYHFQNTAEEIMFFKEIKPNFYSELIYHHKLYNILLEWPEDPEDIEEYIRAGKIKIESLKAHNFLYKYFKSKETYLDEMFFVRHEEYSSLSLPIYDINTPSYFTTHYDYYISKILANSRLLDYFSKYSEKKTNIFSPLSSKELPDIVFTGPKIGLVELLYALSEDKAFNNGQANLNDIFDYFKIVLNVDIDNPTRSFQELLTRKSGPTTYLEKLAGRLNTRVQVIESKHIRK